MVLGIGTDIIEIERVEKAVKNKRFMEKCFTADETLLFNSKMPQTVAGNFAAKESVAKALGTGFRKFALKDIEILRDEDGKPYVKLYRHAERLAQTLGITCIHITISHSIKYAIAYALAEGGSL